MGMRTQEFSRALLLSLAADYFLISKQLGLTENKNFRSTVPLASIYRKLFSSNNLDFAEWDAPFSGAVMFCSPSEDDLEMDRFFDAVEELAININIGIRGQHDIPIPKIYCRDGKLDEQVATKYISDIEQFVEKIPSPDNHLGIPTVDRDGNFRSVTVNLQGITKPDSGVLKIEELLKGAIGGDPIAAYDLAVAYESGHEVTQELSEALHWYRQSAEAGNADSKYRIGRIFHFGLNGQVDFGEAVRWYRQAIDHGHLAAKVNLARMYVSGEGVEQNYKAAELLFYEASLEGDADAQNNLGCIYVGGLGTAKDEAKAADWFERSAAQGNQKAQLSLALMYRDGIGVRQDSEQCHRWLSASAAQGDDVAQLHLGLMLYTGQGVPEDQWQGMRWLNAAADQGNESAIELLSELKDEEESTNNSIDDFSSMPEPMVKTLDNGARHLWVTVEELQWSESSNVILGEMTSERETLQFDTHSLTAVALISHAFYEILKSRGVPDEEAIRPGASIVPGDRVTIDWRVQGYPEQALSGLWRMTYHGMPGGRHYGYRGDLTDYYYGDDEKTKIQVRHAKLRLIAESDMDEDMKALYSGAIDADFNQQISIP
jgi:TPR repeat protein